MNWWDVWIDALPRMLDGLKLSLALTAVSLVLGLALGLVLAVGSTARTRWLRWPAITLVEVGRGAPALVMLYMVYYGLPQAGLTLTAFTSAVVGLTITTGAYTSEYIRTGLRSVPRGTVEAAQALAMSPRDVFFYVIAPQGIRIAIPGLAGFAIQLFQITSLAYSITVRELTAVSYSISTQTFQYLTIFALTGVLYAVIAIPATRLTGLLERRLSVGH